MSTPPQHEFDHRVARARALMDEHGADALVVTDPLNYSYYSGHRTPAWMKSRPSIFILPRDGAPTIILWSGPEMFARLYDRPFPSWVEDRRIYPEVPFNREPRVDWGIADVLKERGAAGGRIAIELGRETWLGIPVVDFDLLKEQLPGSRFIDSGPIVWGCRLIKSEWEIDCMRRACAIGGRAWQRCFEGLKPGVSITQVQRTILQYYGEEGADLSSGAPTVLGATGPGGTFQNGDVLYLDGGCTFAGYGMDFTRRAVFGPPSARQLDEHNGMWDILFKVMERMKPGVPVSEIFDYSQSLLAARPQWRNYSDHPAKRIGHGIGLENEPPSICGFDDTVLEVGMVLTPEPKIESVDGLVNPEEHVVVRRSGCEILSTIPDWKLHVVA